MRGHGDPWLDPNARKALTVDRFPKDLQGKNTGLCLNYQEKVDLEFTILCCKLRPVQNQRGKMKNDVSRWLEPSALDRSEHSWAGRRGCRRGHPGVKELNIRDNQMYNEY